MFDYGQCSTTGSVRLQASVGLQTVFDCRQSSTADSLRLQAVFDYKPYLTHLLQVGGDVLGALLDVGQASVRLFQPPNGAARGGYGRHAGYEHNKVPLVVHLPPEVQPVHDPHQHVMDTVRDSKYGLITTPTLSVGSSRLLYIGHREAFLAEHECLAVNFSKNRHNSARNYQLSNPQHMSRAVSYNNISFRLEHFPTKGPLRMMLVLYNT